MSQNIKVLAGQELALEQLDAVSGGFFDKKYSYTVSKDYSNIGNTTANVQVTQWGNGNSATGAGAINTTFA